MLHCALARAGLCAFPVRQNAWIWPGLLLPCLADMVHCTAYKVFTGGGRAVTNWQILRLIRLVEGQPVEPPKRYNRSIARPCCRRRSGAPTRRDRSPTRRVKDGLPSRGQSENEEAADGGSYPIGPRGPVG
jgi:hypothetical protein